MLIKVRKLSSGLLVKLFFVAVILTMVLWGIDNKKTQKNYLVSIDSSHYIYPKTFIRAKRHFINSLNQQYPGVSLENINVNKIVLDNLIQEKLLETELSELGLLVSNDVAIEEIKNNELFHNKDQKFDKDLFKKLLMSNELSEADYLKQLKTNIAAKALHSIIPKVEPSPYFVNEFYKYNNQKRIVELITIKNNSKDNLVKVSDEEIQQYYDKNKDEFAIPEYRDLEYIVIKSSSFSQDAKVTDSELEQEISTLEEAPEKINDQEKAKIKQRLAEKKMLEVLYHKMKQIEDDLASGDSLKDVSERFKLQYVEVNEVDKKGLVRGGVASKRIPANHTKFLQEAFDLDTNNPSDAIQLSNKDEEHYILNVKKVHPASFSDLATVKNKIFFNVSQQKKEKIAHESATKIYASLLEDSSNKQKILTDSNVTVKTLILARPDSAEKDFDSNNLNLDIVIDVFNLKSSNAATKIFKTKDGSFAFAILKDVELPKMQISQSDYTKIQSEISNFMSAAVYHEFIDYLRARHKIKINQEMLASLSYN